jgi:trigger factor
MNHTVKKLEKSRVEIEGELAVDIFEGYRARALEHLGAHIEVDGFRKGHVPASVLIKHIPENLLLEEMAEMALGEHYPKILETEKLDAIGRPQIAITKLASGNPLGFKITFDTLPEITLPDYKKIAEETRKEKIDVEVTEKDIDETILQIRRMRAHEDLHKEGGHAHDDHSHAPVTDENLPVFDDEFVKTLGAFESVEMFKEKLKENISKEKERESRSTMRLKIAEALLEKTTMDIPQILIESEVEKMMFRLKTDVENAGIVFEEYLKNISKTEDDIKKEWEPDAKKKASLELMIFEIAKEEKMKLDEKDIENEVNAVLSQYPGADKMRAQAYVEQVLMHEKVFSLLEGRE